MEEVYTGMLFLNKVEYFDDEESYNIIFQASFAIQSIKHSRKLIRIEDLPLDCQQMKVI
jgi:hypothetical protein